VQIVALVTVAGFALAALDRSPAPPGAGKTAVAFDSGASDLGVIAIAAACAVAAMAAHRRRGGAHDVQ
jgi:hypothetical protein